MTEVNSKVPEIKSGAWETVKTYAKGAAEGFTGYFREKYSGTNGIGDALSRANSHLNEGFEMMDEYNPANCVKKPIKELSRKIDAKVSDGNPETMTTREKVWNAVKGAGKVVDGMTTAKGITYGCLTAGTLGVAGKAVSAAVGGIPATVKAAADVAGVAGGSALAGKGVYDVATAENEKDAQKGGAEILTGGVLAGASAARLKGDFKAAGAELKAEAQAHTEWIENMSPAEYKKYKDTVDLCGSYGIGRNEAEKLYLRTGGKELTGSEIRDYIMQKRNNLSFGGVSTPGF